MTVVEVELTADSDTTVFLDGDIVASTATLSLVDPNGSTLQTPVVTLPSVSTTTASGTTATVLTLASVAGISPGDKLIITSDGVAYVVEAAVVDAAAKTVTLTSGLPVVPDEGSPVKSVRMTATVTAPGSSAIGANYRLSWEFDDGETFRTVGQPASVVRWPWTAPCSASDVRDVVAELNGGNRSNQWCQDVADRVDDRIKGAIARTGRRPWLYLASLVFSDVARTGIRLELAQRGICFGQQPYEAQRELRFAFDDSLASVITGLAAYDANGDGQIDSSEATPSHYSIQGVR